MKLPRNSRPLRLTLLLPVLLLTACNYGLKPYPQPPVTAGWRAYKRLAGEVEARNTQARQGMTPAQRQATSPESTADVAASDVIVTFNGKEMANAPSPANAQAMPWQAALPAAQPLKSRLQAVLLAKKEGAEVVQADNGEWLLAPKAEAYNAQEAKDAQGRIERLNRVLTGYGVAPAQVLLDAPTPAMAWGRSIARTLGFNVTFIEANASFDGVAIGGDAFVGPRTKHPAIGLIGHEVLHVFKREEPALYEAMVERIRPYLKDGVVDAKRQWEDANGGKNTTQAHAEEEVVADLNGAMWLDPQFWRSMAQNDPGLFRRVAYNFMEVATKAMKGLSRFKADQLVTDVEAVRNIIAQEWAMRAQEMGNPSEFTEAGAAFSRGVADTTQAGLQALADLARTASNENKTVEVGKVSAEQIRMFADEGLAVSPDFTHTTDMFAVRHALNRHSDAKVEKSRGQLPLTDGEIAAIPAAIKSPDAIVLGPKTPRNQDVIGYIKRLADGTVLYLEEVRTGRKTLAMTSMRRYPGATDFSTIANSTLPSNAQSDTEDVRIIYPDGNAGQESPRFSRAAPSASSGQTAPPTHWQSIKARATGLLSAERIDNFLYQYQDKLIDLKRLRQHIKDIGGTITDLNDAYQGEELYHKRVAKRSEDFLVQELKPLLAEMRSKGISLEDFETFLHARHAPEANKELSFRNPTVQMIDDGKAAADLQIRDIELALQRAHVSGSSVAALNKALENAMAERHVWTGAQAFKGSEAERLSLSGMSDADAAATMAALAPQKRQQLDALAQRVDAMNRKTMGALKDYGLMDPGVLDLWDKTYKHYVPLHRDEAHPDSISHPVGQGFSVKGDTGKRRAGSNQKVTNILAHIAMQRESALTRGEKNMVSQKLYMMAAQNPDADWWSVDHPPSRTYVDAKTGLAMHGVDPMYKGLPNVVMLRIAGKDAAIVFNERNERAARLAGALKNLDASDMGVVLNIASKGTRWFASVNTQYNPVFGVINFTRDVQAALLGLSTTPLRGKESQVAKHMMPALRGIYAAQRARRLGARAGGAWGVLWEQMQLDGGITGYRDLFAAPKERAEALEKVMSNFDRGNGAKFAHGMLDWLNDYNESMEGATRLAAYKVALESGMTRPQAASLAKNITVNFNRKGAATSKIGALYAFFNAAVQGSARMMEVLTGPTGKKVMAGGVLLGAMNAMIGIAMMGGDDEHDENGWAKVPEFVRERSIVIPLGSEDFVAIPMPMGFSIFPNIGRKAVEAMAGLGNKSTGAQLADMLGMAINTFNPLGAPSDASLSQMALMLSPTVTDPVISLLANKDWTGKPIYRADNNSMDPTPGHQRTKDTASTLSKLASRWLNALSGGTDYRPGAVSWTPDQIDYVVGQLTGGVGREFLKLNQALAVPFNGDELPAHKIPLLGRIYGNTRGATAESGPYSENVRELNEVENELKGRARDDKDPHEYRDKEPLTEMIGRGNQAERMMSQLRKLRSRALADDDAERVKELNDRIGEVMKDLNRDMRAARREAAASH